MVASSFAYGETISGTVTNMTTHRPSAGDEVVLMGLQNGMQVVARTTTNDQGRYTLNIADKSPVHLLRVTHDKVEYFQPIQPGTQTLNMDVYSAAGKVTGISTSADVVRFETGSNGLEVIENYFVENASSPQMTQSGPRSYEFYLPKEAKIVSAAALGPGGMPVQSSPVPVGQPGNYSFVFPLRPGETRFQINYRLPYSGSFHFKPRFAAPVDNFAVILPKTMQFAGVPSASFQPIHEDPRVQTYLTRNLTPQTELAFRIAGTGQLPKGTPTETNGQSTSPNAAGAAVNPREAAQNAAESDTRPGIGLGVPIDTPDPLRKYQWWILSLVVVLLAVGTGVSMKRNNPRPDPAMVPTAGASTGVLPNGTVKTASSSSDPSAMGASAMQSDDENRRELLKALKEELFALETERLENQISPEEYDRQKAALEIVMKRALSRTQAHAGNQSSKP